MANAVIGGTDIVLTMPLNEKLEFKEAVLQRLTSGPELVKFLHIFSNINSERSEASFEKDLFEIKSFIVDKLGGFDSVDRKVANALRLWIGVTVKSFCET